MIDFEDDWFNQWKGKPTATKMDEFSEILRREVISNPTNSIAVFLLYFYHEK